MNYTNVRTSSNLQIEELIDGRTLKKRCTQKSSRHKNCRIGGLMFDSMIILEIQFQTVFYPGFSKRNTASVKAPSLEKRIPLADKSDNHALYHITSQIWQLLQHGMGLQARPVEGQVFYFFLFGGSLTESDSHTKSVLRPLKFQKYSSLRINFFLQHRNIHTLNRHKTASFLSMISTHSVDNFNNV